LDAQQRLQQIGRLLDASSRKTRQIYFAHRAGYSYEEISQHLGVSHMTIRRHISRALLLIMDASP
jgi:DNA-directed RNA polymerase specialized sigma24 family protein